MAAFKIGDKVQVIDCADDEAEHSYVGAVGVVTEIRKLRGKRGPVVVYSVRFEVPQGERYFIAAHLAPATVAPMEAFGVKKYDAADEAQKWLDERHEQGIKQAGALTLLTAIGRVYVRPQPLRALRGAAASIPQETKFYLLLIVNLAAVLVFSHLAESVGVAVLGLALWGMGMTMGWMWLSMKQRVR